MINYQSPGLDAIRGNDPFFDRAKAIAEDSGGKCSYALLQRRLHIGTQRAQYLMDELRDKGIIN
jgi:DNA segregation ATPase FtsK/SpoIIIE-like protein